MLILELLGVGGAVPPSGFRKFSLRLIGSAMFGATFNLVTRVGLP